MSGRQEEGGLVSLAASGTGGNGGAGCNGGAGDSSRLHAFLGDFTWEGIPVERYKDESGGWSGISRTVLAGRSERVGFHLRYFEVSPGGYSSLECHSHSHVVLGARGRGKAVVGDQCWDVGFMDVVYIAPGTPHQFVNAGEESFGFLCLVDAERDRPRHLTGEEIERLERNPLVSSIMRLGPGGSGGGR